MFLAFGNFTGDLFDNCSRPIQAEHLTEAGCQEIRIFIGLYSDNYFSLP